MTEPPNVNTKFASDEGRIITRHQVGMSVWKEGATVEQTDSGHLVNGVEYRQIAGNEDALV